VFEWPIVGHGEWDVARRIAALGGSSLFLSGVAFAHLRTRAHLATLIDPGRAVVFAERALASAAY
jgi:hypothetical protein